MTDIWVVTTFWRYAWYCYEHSCVSVWSRVFSLLGRYLGLELLGYMAIERLIDGGAIKLFRSGYRVLWAYWRCTIRGFRSLGSSPTLVLFLFFLWPSQWVWRGVSLWCWFSFAFKIHLHLRWCWISFHVLFGHTCIFLGGMSIQVRCPFFNCFVLLSSKSSFCVHSEY